jgi:hypothetical protein
MAQTFRHTDDIITELAGTYGIQDPDNPMVDLDSVEFLDLDAARGLIEALSEIGTDAELCPEDEFENYARELAESVGAISDTASWPNNHIDWKAAAESLRQDYSWVVINDVEYLYREC